MSKDRRSFSIDQEIKRELERRNDINASGVVNKFLHEFLFDSEASHEEAAIEMMLKDVNHQIETKEEELDRLHSRREDLEERLDEIRSSGVSEDLEEAFETVENIYEDRSNMWGKTNPAVETQAGKVGLDPATFVKRFEEWYGSEAGDGAESVAAEE
jgi:predicted  nucleic acid-binding Zn-ribbon protein